MKNSPFNTILLAAIVLSSLWSIWLCYTLISRTRDLRTLQAEANFVNYQQAVLNNLMGEAVEYGKKNPAIDPLLESLGVKQRTNTVSTSKPAAK
jgi:hypothetical protein